MKHAVSYLRVSSPGQVAGDGLPRQRAAISAYARSARLDIVAEFADEGVSGSLPLADRPGLSALFTRVLESGVCAVIVESSSRLARDLVEGELILREFRTAGVRVVATDGTDLTAGDDLDPTAKLIRQILGAVAEFEKSLVVCRLRAARQRAKKERGRCEGRRPYGATEVERAALVRLKQLARKPRGRPRRSLQEIADALTDEGYPTRLGGPWRRSTVRGILRRLRARTGP